MNQSIPQELPRAGLWRPAVIALTVGLGVLAAASGALWFHYGTAVFYEMIVAGLNACF